MQPQTDIPDGLHTADDLLRLIEDPERVHMAAQCDRIRNIVLREHGTCAEIRNGVFVAVRTEPTHAPTAPLAEPERQKRKYTRRQFGQT